MKIDLTRYLRSYRDGDPRALDEVMPVIYHELRRIARRMLANTAAVSLSPTEIVHELYLRLVDQSATDWRDRAHCLAYMTTVMRRLLVDEIRRRNADKRGGQLTRVTLSDVVPAHDVPYCMLDVDAALSRLESVDARDAAIVNYRVFAGLSTSEVAEVIGVSTSTVEKRWRGARAWLLHELESYRTTG